MADNLPAGVRRRRRTKIIYRIRPELVSDGQAELRLHFGGPPPARVEVEFRNYRKKFGDAIWVVYADSTLARPLALAAWLLAALWVPCSLAYLWLVRRIGQHRDFPLNTSTGVA